MGTKLRQAEGQPRYLFYWCQGCKGTHGIDVGPGHWTWDGNQDAPTFNPSVLVTYSGGDAGEDRGDDERAPARRCHTFIRAGQVEFLADCSHALAGQTLPMPDWPYADGAYGGVEPLPPEEDTAR